MGLSMYNQTGKRELPIDELNRRVVHIEKALAECAEKVALAHEALKSKPGESGFEDMRSELMQMQAEQSPRGATVDPISDEVCAFKIKHAWVKALDEQRRLVGEAEQILFSLKHYARQRDTLLSQARAFPSVEQETDLRATLDKLIKREVVAA